MRLFSFLFFLCTSIASQAVIVADLYDVEIEVENQSSSELNQAVRTGLQQVLVKVTGSIDTLSATGTSQAISSAMSYVKSYRYNHKDDQLILRVQFAPKLIDSQLKQLGLPIWGRSRPLLLVWQAVEIDHQRSLINHSSEELHEEFNHILQARGLPTLWPALDLDDQINLPVNHLWGMFREDIENASKRYLSDAFLAGKLSLNSNEDWQYQGYLQLNSELLDINLTHTDQAVLLQQLSEHIAAFLAQHYAVVETAIADGHPITVHGIKNFNQYQQLLEFLSSHGAIKKVQVAAVKQEQIDLILDLSANWQRIWQTLSFDKRLQEIEENSIYQWHN